MTERPASLELLDRQLMAARFAHEAAADPHRELVELDADDDHTRELLRESAVLTLERMPALARPVGGSESEWEEQELLDPAAAKRTAERLEEEVEELLPALRGLRARQDEIVTELRALVTDAR